MSAAPETTAPLFLSAAETQAVLDWPSVCHRLRDAYIAAAASESGWARRAVVRGNGGTMRVQAAVPCEGGIMGAKVFGHGALRQTEYAVVLIDKASGHVLALVDGLLVTAVRTAATTAIALDRMCGPGPLRLAVLGSGHEARAHIEALASLRSIDELRIYSPTPVRRDALALAMGTRFDSRATLDPQAAVAGANVVIAAARSRAELPILYANWLSPSAIVASIGSTVPQQRELDVSVIAASELIVCDEVEEVLGDTGDMIAARAAGITMDDRVASLAHLLSGRLDRRLALARMPLFKSVGSALQDVEIAALAFERAKSMGLGRALPGAFATKR